MKQVLHSISQIKKYVYIQIECSYIITKVVWDTIRSESKKTEDLAITNSYEIALQEYDAVRRRVLQKLCSRMSPNTNKITSYIKFHTWYLVSGAKFVRNNRRIR